MDINIKEKKIEKLCYLYAYLFISTISLQASNDLYIASLTTLLKQHPEITYVPYRTSQTFSYQPFPLSEFPQRQPHAGIFAPTYILRIPQGQVFSHVGFVKINNQIILELMPEVQFFDQSKLLRHAKFDHCLKISGKVAVITKCWSNCYFHWLTEILIRLAMLQELDIDYDWLYVPCHLPFMKETLHYFNIDPTKIITPHNEHEYIQADELIVPSYPSRRILPNNKSFTKDIGLAFYCQDWMIAILRSKFLPLINQTPTTYAKKIFISRKDSKIRNMINEDEIFALFEQKGFTRYCLSKLSVLEQIRLFHHAEIVAGAHGAGLTNILFCKPQTKILEIFQTRSDCAYYYFSQQLNLDYHCLKTTNFRTDFGFQHTRVNPDMVKNWLDNITDLE